MRRFRSAILALVFVISCVCISVSAEGVPGQYDVVDLLPSTSYIGNVADAASPIVTGSRTSYSLGWNTTFSGELSAVILTFSSPSQPSSVVCNGVTGTLLSSGTYYQYRFAMSRSVDDLSFTFKYSTSTSRRISVLSCSGMVSGQVALSALDEITFRPYGRDWVTYGSRALPYSYWNSYSIPGANNMSSSTNSEQMRVFYNVTVKAADYFTAVYFVPCYTREVGGYREPWASEPLFWLCDGSTRLYALETINYQTALDAHFTMQVGDHVGQTYPFRVIATCDLSGYDLSRVSDPRIEMDYSLYGIYYSGDTTNYTSFGSYFLHAVFGVDVDYSPLSSFSQFVGGLFSTLTSKLSELFDNLGTRIENAINPPNSETVPVNEFSDAAGGIDDFEQSQMGAIDSNMSIVQSSVSVSGIATSLAFVQRYANGVFSGLGDATLLFTFPLFLGIFFYLCSRVPNNTHHKGGDDSP